MDLGVILSVIYEQKMATGYFLIKSNRPPFWCRCNNQTKAKLVSKPQVPAWIPCRSNGAKNFSHTVTKTPSNKPSKIGLAWIVGQVKPSSRAGKTCAIASILTMRIAHIFCGRTLAIAARPSISSHESFLLVATRVCYEAVGNSGWARSLVINELRAKRAESIVDIMAATVAAINKAKRYSSCGKCWLISPIKSTNTWSLCPSAIDNTKDALIALITMGKVVNSCVRKKGGKTI